MRFSHWLQKRNVHTFGFLALITGVTTVLLGGFLVFKLFITQHEKDSGRLINLAGRQRMLIQQIAKEALLMTDEPNLLLKKNHIRSLLNSAYIWHTVFVRMETGNREIGLPGFNSPEATALIEQLQPTHDRIHASLKKIRDASPDEMERLTTKSPVIQNLISAVDPFLYVMDRLVSQYEQEARESLNEHEVLEGLSLIPIFLMLLQVLIIIRPMQNRIKSDEEELRKSNENLRDEITSHIKTGDELRQLTTAVEQAWESVVITDYDGVIQYVNPAFERNTGYTSKEVLGETSRLLKSGKQDAAYYRAMWETLRRGEVWQGVFVNKRKDGTLLEEKQTISPVRDQEGKIVGFIGIKNDITHEMDLERQLRQSQRLEAIGSLSGGIAHDFNNILTPILGYTELLQSKLNQDASEQKYLSHIEKSATRARDLIRQILQFSRIQPVEFTHKPLNAGKIVTEVLSLLRSTLPSTIQFEENIQSDLPLIMGDETEIHSVIMNLCINASQAMPNGGLLMVSLTDLAAADLPNKSIPKERFICLTVEDTGIGMDEATRERVFEPFFTTKDPGAGTGLGLSSVYGIVKRMDGDTTLESTPNKGTRIRIFLPVKGIATEKQQIVEGPAPEGKGHILLVDDDRDIVLMGKNMLENLGYQVTTASNGIEALDSLQKQPDDFNLLVTDQTMPKLTGLELIRLVKQDLPNLPVLLVSGFHDVVNKKDVSQVDIREFLQKPFTGKSLGWAVHRAIHEPALPALAAADENPTPSKSSA